MGFTGLPSDLLRIFAAPPSKKIEQGPTQLRLKYEDYPRLGRASPEEDIFQGKRRTSILRNVQYRTKNVLICTT